jgi:hypothetical protein
MAGGAPPRALLHMIDTLRAQLNLRDFLDRREKELTEQLAERKRRAIPYEAEMAEIRRAKSALGVETPAPTLQAGVSELRRYLESRERELRDIIDEIAPVFEDFEIELAEVKKVKAAIGLEPTKEFRAGDAVGQPLAEWESVPGATEIPYQSHTIRELVIRALTSHFPTGATIGDMIQFFRDNWGRTIERQSLSPQLSRLYRDGIIGRLEGTHQWYLIREEYRGKRPYRRPVPVLLEGQVKGMAEDTVWLAPHEVQADDKPIGDPVLDPDPNED